ncbi:MAG: EamA family transporter [Planctomycetia bacterium]
MSTIAMSRGRDRLLLVLALGALWILWGSTYLSIRVAVRSIPPFTMAGCRFVLAGGALCLWLLATRAPLFERRAWRGGLASGFLLVLCSNGLVSWSSRALDSNIVALLVATVPMWMALLETLGGKRQGPLVWLAVALGLAGVATLAWPAADGLPLHPPSVAALMVATLCWSFGSLWSRGAMQGVDARAFAAAQMLCGGVLQLAAGALMGEWRGFDPRSVPPSGWGNMLYLAVAGSLVGFSAYLWLLRHHSSSLAASYAFVNPLVALLLAATIGEETLGPRTLPAALLILAAVVCVLRLRARESKRAA